MLRRLFVLSLITLNASGILISGGRTPIVVLLVIVVAMLVYTIVYLVGYLALRARLRRAHVSIVKAIVGVSLVLIILGMWGHEYFTTLTFRLTSFSQGPEKYAADRMEMIPVATEAILKFPWGLGIGGFSMYYHHFDAKRGEFPHNVFLEIGSELGFIGLAGFVLLCYWASASGVRGLRTVKDNRYFIGLTLLSLFWFMLIYFQFHGDINDARTLFTWAGALFAYRRFVAKGSPYA
jgi:O-antigen ligase